VPATIDGMMGGLTEISKRDLRTSHDFLKYFLDGKCPNRKATSATRALDCGAGIGRVTSNLLLPLFDTVDMVEQSDKFVDEAKRLIKSSKMGCFYCSGLQDFTFTHQYDVIWIQWVIGHLHDTDLVQFISKCKLALAPYGLLCIKDNTCENGFVFDKEDSSVTRSDQHLRALFEQASLKLVKELIQPNFPKKLFPVRIYALE
jgi:protein N-terminal methyltransferase